MNRGLQKDGAMQGARVLILSGEHKGKQGVCLGEVPAYAELQRAMHDALLQQHPEWIERDGNCPKCHDYDRRFAQLLGLSLAFARAHAC